MKHTEATKEKIRQKKLNPIKNLKEKVCEMAKQGKPTKEISNFFSVCPQHINKILRENT